MTTQRAENGEQQRPAAALPACPVCRSPLDARPARGRKSGKPFIMLACPDDGRHFRAFIADARFVSAVIEKSGRAGENRA